MAFKYKQEIITAIVMAGFVIGFYFLYGLILPFFIGLFLAFASRPAIKRIQRIFKNRDLSVTIYLLVLLGILFLAVLQFASYVNKDFNRLNQSFQTIVSENQDQLDKTQQKIKSYLGKVYDFDALKETIQAQADSLKSTIQSVEVGTLDMDSIQESIGKILSFFKKDDASPKKQKGGFSLVFIFFTTLMYFVLILYNLPYFESVRARYFKNKWESRLQFVWDDFNDSFVRYFRLRTSIVSILSIIYLIAFMILDLPGMILFTVFIFLLSYVSYLQYLMLIPIAISCLVLSIENEHHFLVYYGIVIGVFVVASLIEELVLIPRIMEKHIGMNPVIMVLALSVWGYVLGLPGILIGIPLTSLIIIYLKRYVLKAE